MDRLTRRHALKLGAGAAALAVLPSPARALAAACDVPVFELAMPLDSARASASAGWRTLPVVRAPRRFDLVGLRWTRGRHVHAQVRARTRRGEWTRWTDLHAHGDHAPDGTDAPPGTDPCWTGAADLLQVRLKGDVRGLRARFVRSGPAARSAGTRARASRQAQQPAGAPRIFTRAEWGGDQCAPREPASYGDVQLAFVHHTVSANDYGPGDSAAIVLGICRYHRDSNKWNDIGYNFLVDKYGQVFEGRAGGVDQAVIGAQAQGYNSHSTGIACIGDFSAVAQAEPAMDALARLIGWKLSLHGVPVQGAVTVTSGGGSSNRYPYGTPVTLQRISGHRDGDQTSCPGDVLYGQLEDLRNRAAGYAAPLSSLSMKAATGIVRHPQPVDLSGALRFSDGASAAGAPIEIQYQAAGGAWTVLEQIAANPDGTWATQIAAPSTGMMRARFPGDAGHPPLEAAAVTITVLPQLILKLAPRRVRAGEKVAVTGTLGPTWPQRIELLLEIKRRGRWVKVQRKKINVRSGGFASVVRPKQPGLYRVSAIAPGATKRRLVRAVR